MLKMKYLMRKKVEMRHATSLLKNLKTFHLKFSVNNGRARRIRSRALQTRAWRAQCQSRPLCV